jgi:hypothetical protein
MTYTMGYIEKELGGEVERQSSCHLLIKRERDCSRNVTKFNSVMEYIKAQDSLKTAITFSPNQPFLSYRESNHESKSSDADVFKGPG